MVSFSGNPPEPGAVKPEAPEPDRNTLALDRTVLANERTYQAWLRTGLTALVSGLGVAKFLKDMMPLWMLVAVAMILILLGDGKGHGRNPSKPINLRMRPSVGKKKNITG